jgi:hypothetical protein
MTREAIKAGIDKFYNEGALTRRQAVGLFSTILLLGDEHRDQVTEETLRACTQALGAWPELPPDVGELVESIVTAWLEG